MYDATIRANALARIDSGESLRSVSIATGINRSTLREWRETRGAYKQRPCRCPTCGGDPPPLEPYLYLLGQYLGDGCISPVGRSWTLRICCCDRYPRIMDEVEAAMRAVAAQSVWRVRSVGCSHIQSTTKQWLHFFPQHGPGMKHTRLIELDSWQQELVDVDPRPLIRGLIHSDGCRVTNWTEQTVAGTTKRYTYPRYFFTNASDDIRRIFTDALDQLGIAWRPSNARNISIARREAVAALDEFVGPKS